MCMYILTYKERAPSYVHSCIVLYCIVLFVCLLVDDVYKRVECRPRSLSDPTIISQLRKPDNTFQEESFRIMANSERKRRLDVEKKLDKHISGLQLDLHFPELLFTGKNSQDPGDDSSSTTSTWDEGDLQSLLLTIIIIIIIITIVIIIIFTISRGYNMITESCYTSYLANSHHAN